MPETKILFLAKEGIRDGIQRGKYVHSGDAIHAQVKKN
jgi:hypothetical protein